MRLNEVLLLLFIVLSLGNDIPNGEDQAQDLEHISEAKIPEISSVWIEAFRQYSNGEEATISRTQLRKILTSAFIDTIDGSLSNEEQIDYEKTYKKAVKEYLKSTGKDKFTMQELEEMIEKREIFEGVNKWINTDFYGYMFEKLAPVNILVDEYGKESIESLFRKEVEKNPRGFGISFAIWQLYKTSDGWKSFAEDLDNVDDFSDMISNAETEKVVITTPDIKKSEL